MAGKYGEGIKVQVSAPSEGGKANRAVEEFIAGVLGVKAQQVRVVRGHGHPRKVVEIDGVEQEELLARLNV